ncbi:MAG: hypothetical protein PHF05_00015 [Candidatus Izemoplasmatales bacterium]|nr:hypothetical protein [Candidatus Izemoplasmatales bacterium]
MITHEKATDKNIITKQVVINTPTSARLLPITADKKVIDEIQQALNELERLKKFKETFDNYELSKKQDFIAYENWQECEAELKKSPTAEEVCMALSEYLITKVVYKHKTRTFSLRKSTFNVELVSYYYDEDKKDYVMHFEFAEPLPPHLIVMIGRFYEGEIK